MQGHLFRSQRRSTLPSFFRSTTPEAGYERRDNPFVVRTDSTLCVPSLRMVCPCEELVVDEQAPAPASHHDPDPDIRQLQPDGRTAWYPSGCDALRLPDPSQSLRESKIQTEARQTSFRNSCALDCRPLLYELLRSNNQSVCSTNHSRMEATANPLAARG
jgi:hypothetical protein